ncbi:MAG: hypothetical protein UY98_C0040G0012 [Candidatus Kaiserbacteria bacterium GW2011_GWA2_58_9]|uniref:Uncharacterized protein n=1 Tax=Candidatus Kaiserbacteria bacterium GW2011_GWA2_58_9 TaxID=1618672 RepID=A0A0G2AW32_9BACT|nr:MAG: hypothetical protein UY98_C0040G0012 [Candidatus Kaiserbacteria bacterium GW2011_GWA2_58_9]
MARETALEVACPELACGEPEPEVVDDACVEDAEVVSVCADAPGPPEPAELLAPEDASLVVPGEIVAAPSSPPTPHSPPPSSQVCTSGFAALSSDSGAGGGFSGGACGAGGVLQA